MPAGSDFLGLLPVGCSQQERAGGAALGLGQWAMEGAGGPSSAPVNALGAAGGAEKGERTRELPPLPLALGGREAGREGAPSPGRAGFVPLSLSLWGFKYPKK